MSRLLDVPEKFINAIGSIMLLAAWYLGAFRADPDSAIVIPFIVIAGILGFWSLAALWNVRAGLSADPSVPLW